MATSRSATICSSRASPSFRAPSLASSASLTVVTANMNAAPDSVVGLAHGGGVRPSRGRRPDIELIPARHDQASFLVAASFS